MGIIQCGSFVGNTTVNIGWEPQWIMIKRTDAAGDWIVIDSMRGCSVGGVDAVLNPNLANAESISNDYIDFTATGFITKNLTGTYIYTVIRRPNKPPTTGTEVYNAIARTGTGAAATVTGVGFAPDALIVKKRSLAGTSGRFNDRLRSPSQTLYPDLTASEGTDTSALLQSFNMDGISVGSDADINGTTPFVNHFFRRAPGFFEICCYTGNGDNTPVGQTIKHSLGVVPEIIIVKSRSLASTDWYVYSKTYGNAYRIFLNNSLAADGPLTDIPWKTPTATTFGVGNGGTSWSSLNNAGDTYVAYLFASLPGISKVGSYTGNGTSQTINCGFTTGCRFFLVKSTSTTGNWWTFDSSRGIVAASDPALQLNSNAAEITSADAVDNDPSGIIVNQEATCSINASGVSYIFLAIS